MSILVYHSKKLGITDVKSTKALVGNSSDIILIHQDEDTYEYLDMEQISKEDFQEILQGLTEI